LKKKLIIILLFFSCFFAYGQIDNNYEKSLFINIVNIGFNPYRDNGNEANGSISFQLLRFNYIFERRLGITLSPFTWSREFAIDDISSDYRTMNFLNIEAYYNLFHNELSPIEDDKSFLFNTSINFGPYISINYLNWNSKTNFSLLNIIFETGLQFNFHSVIYDTPIESFITYRIGYRYISFTENKHSIYFGIDADLIQLFLLLSRRFM